MHLNEKELLFNWTTGSYSYAFRKSCAAAVVRVFHYDASPTLTYNGKSITRSMHVTTGGASIFDFVLLDVNSGDIIRYNGSSSTGGDAGWGVVCLN